MNHAAWLLLVPLAVAVTLAAWRGVGRNWLDVDDED